ncbi:MAG: hypothetical protein AVDCRST_MAG53-1984, partial [uncultured Solirubrobacteraceae bacterium]
GRHRRAACRGRKQPAGAGRASSPDALLADGRPPRLIARGVAGHGARERARSVRWRRHHHREREPL